MKIPQVIRTCGIFHTRDELFDPELQFERTDAPTANFQPDIARFPGRPQDNQRKTVECVNRRALERCMTRRIAVIGGNDPGRAFDREICQQPAARSVPGGR